MRLKGLRNIADLAMEYNVSVRFIRRMCKKEHINIVRRNEQEYINKKLMKKVEERIMDRQEREIRKDIEFSRHLESLNESFYF